MYQIFNGGGLVEGFTDNRKVVFGYMHSVIVQGREPHIPEYGVVMVDITTIFIVL